MPDKFPATNLFLAQTPTWGRTATGKRPGLAANATALYCLPGDAGPLRPGVPSPSPRIDEPPAKVVQLVQKLLNPSRQVSSIRRRTFFWTRRVGIPMGSECLSLRALGVKLEVAGSISPQKHDRRRVERDFSRRRPAGGDAFSETCLENADRVSDYFLGTTVSFMPLLTRNLSVVLAGI